MFAVAKFLENPIICGSCHLLSVDRGHVWGNHLHIMTSKDPRLVHDLRKDKDIESLLGR
jgi:hypothetical protein